MWAWKQSQKKIKKNYYNKYINFISYTDYNELIYLIADKQCNKNFKL